MRFAALTSLCLLLLLPQMARAVPPLDMIARADSPLSRPVQTVSVSGTALEPLWGKRLDYLSLFVWRKGAFLPVPFQIDKRDVDGFFLFDPKDEEIRRAKRIEEWKDRRTELAAGGASEDTLREMEEEIRKPAQLGLLEEYDELVFMAWDLGTKAPAETFPKDARVASELRITRPGDGAQGYAYLLAFDREAPRSDVDYVTFDVVRQIVETPVAVLDWDDQRHILLKGFFDKQPDGSLRPQMFDRFKLRIHVKPKLLFFGITLDEETTRSETIAYKDGPVRVIRRNTFWIQILGIQVMPTATVDYIFYPNLVLAPTVIDIPVDPVNVLAEGSYLDIIFDHNPETTGSLFYSAGNPVPVVLDGKTEEAEEQLQRENQNWFAMIRPWGVGMVVRAVLSPRMASRGLVPDLYYEDDDTANKRPEAYPGARALGFHLDATKLLKGRQTARFFLYYDPEFSRGDERYYLDSIEKPLEVVAAPVRLLSGSQ